MTDARTDAPVATGHNIDLHLRADVAQRVTIEPADPAPGYWHRVLNILWDEGIVQELSDRGFRTLYAFLRLNDSAKRGGALDENGLVFAPLPRLMAVVRKGRTYVYGARAELLAHPRGLLAERESDRYAVLPNFEWASRSQVRTTGPEPSAPANRLSAIADETSAPADDSCALLRKRARVCSEQKELKQDNNSRSGQSPDAVVVGLLLAAKVGFTEGEAKALARMRGATVKQVRNAIALAEATRDAGDLKISPRRDASRCMRGLIIRAVEREWNLFDQHAADQYEAERAAQSRARNLDHFLATLRRHARDERAFHRLARDIKARFAGWDEAHAAIAAQCPGWKSFHPSALVERLMAAPVVFTEELVS